MQQILRSPSVTPPPPSSETPEGLQEQIENTINRLTANVKNCQVVVRTEDKSNPETFKTQVGKRWSTEGGPAYLPWRRHLQRQMLGYTHSESNRIFEITHRQDGCNVNRLAT